MYVPHKYVDRKLQIYESSQLKACKTSMSYIKLKNKNLITQFTVIILQNNKTTGTC